MTNRWPCLGIDGCRAGWLLALRHPDGRLEFRLLQRLAGLRGLEAAALAIDMPIGLLDGPRAEARPPDRLVRALLGPRRSSVFNPPSRPMLSAQRYEPQRLPGLSVQAFHLRSRIAELDGFLDQPPPCPYGEAHPELAFAQLLGRPLPEPKKRAEGRALRLRLLRQQQRAPLRGLAAALTAARARWTRAEVADDDLLDAAVLTLVAVALAEGRATRFGAEPQTDSRGRPMQILGLGPLPQGPEEPAQIAIRATIDAIPPGRVATYGQVAEEAGFPRQPRRVARLLSQLPPDSRLPWWRVIAAPGRIAAREQPHMRRQARLLLAEGVKVGPRWRIDLERFRWRP